MGSAEPPAEERPRSRYAFGGFTLDLDRGFLNRGAEEVELRPKPFQVLIYLVEHHGRIVSKSELIEAVWPDVAVMDNTVAQCLVEIRRALGDDSQQLIRTVTRRGYLFTCPVSTSVAALPSRSASTEDERSLACVPPDPAVGKRQQRGVVVSALALLALVGSAVLMGFFAWRMWRAPVKEESLRAIPLNSLPGVERYPSFSPDGNHVTFTWTGPKQDNQDVYVQQIGSGSPLRLTTDPRIDYNPVWSPDGRWIAFLRRQWEAGTSELR